MRTVLTISLPERTARLVKQTIKREGFTSTSEFFRHLLRQWQEEKLLAELRASQKEIREGKGKLLRSLADLE